MKLEIDSEIQSPILLTFKCLHAEQEPLTQLINFAEIVNVYKRTHSKEWAHCDVWEVGVGSIPSTLRHAFLPEFVQFIL